MSATVAAALSLLMQQRIATELMSQISEISAVAVLLPLAAGAAGALNQIQSQRSSLVSGAATGMLVAASLAPPVGVMGMAVVLGDWGMVRSGVFLLVLQLVGINLSAAAVFRVAGLSPRGPRYSRGNGWAAWASAAATVVALAAILAWQSSSSPRLQRTSVMQQAQAELQQVVNSSGLGQLVEAQVRFTRPDAPGQPALLCVVWVRGDSTPAQAELKRRIEQRLREKFNVTPLVDLTLLP